MKNNYPRLVFADAKGDVFDFPGLWAAGTKAGRFFRLDPKELIPLPRESEFFLLPGRLPVGFDPKRGEAATLETDPYSKKNKACFAVAAFISPGYTTTYNASYREKGNVKTLPLFSYAACAYYKGRFCAAAVRVDRSPRHIFSCADVRNVGRGFRDLKKVFPKNRLFYHLGHCALVSNCPAAKNFFLGRFEAPIPTSTACNARCLGCISYQPECEIPVTQERIRFTPSAEEIAELAVFHIKRVSDPVVSFGQGCEGEPLLAADVIEESLRLIRSRTRRGVLNLNTNAAYPAVLERLFRAGLDSIRVSLNSVREPYYLKYYRPKDYSFSDVMNSIRAAKKRGIFVSVNYLVMPGFTDHIKEAAAFKKFLKETSVDMIQWRNLNYDPLVYFRKLGVPPAEAAAMIGVAELIASVRKKFPRILTGYFNPGRVKMEKRTS
jgi:pyruvate-formate lyase-activating enzyme